MMAEILDDVAYLSQEIGPRPAGTEEEQQAALFIADQVHKRTNLNAEVEDIKCNANAGLVDIVYFGIAFLAALLSIVVPVIGVVMFFVSLVCTACFLCETRYHRPLLSRVLSRDVSQNVVVKYRPEAAAKSGSRRKIIVVANYDSGKVKNDLKPGLLKAWSVLGHASGIAMIAIPIVLFFKSIVFANALGFVSGFFTLLTIIAAVLLVVPVVRALIHRFGAYNEAANVNASSVAVLLNLIRRAGGSPQDRPLQQTDSEIAEDQPEVKGPQAAEQAGVIPEGAVLQYDDDVVPEGEDASSTPSQESDATVQVIAPDDDDASIPSEAPMVQEASEPVSDEQLVVPDQEQGSAEPENQQEESVLHQGATDASSDAQDVATNEAEASVADEQYVQDEMDLEPAAVPSPEQEDDAYYEESPAERLRAAKAAIAALTGEPVDSNIYASGISEEPVDVRPQPIQVPDERGQERMRSDMMSALGGPRIDETAQNEPAPVAEQSVQQDRIEQPVATQQNTVAPVESVASQHRESGRRVATPIDRVQEEQPPIRKPSVPDWYRSAQEKAKRSDKRAGTVHRSRYADALDSAVKESSVFFKEANQLVDDETESRLRSMRRGISEVKAPTIDDVEPTNPRDDHAPSTVESKVADEPAVREVIPPVQTQSPVTHQEPARPVVHEETNRASVATPTAAPQRPAIETQIPSITGAQAPVTVPEPETTAPQDIAAQDVQPDQQINDSNTPLQQTYRQSVAEEDMAPGQAEAGTESHKVLEDDPSLGHTIAMKPIAMPVDKAPSRDARPNDGQAVESQQRRAPRPIRPRVKLPEIPSANMAPITDTAKQRAPLAQATAVDGKTAAKSLLSHTIPKIDVDSLSGDLGKPVQADNEPAESKRQNLMEHLPSLSGSVSSDSTEQDGGTDKVVSATGSFTAVSATGTFAPVGDELVADIDPADRYVDDADDSIDEGGITESGAFAGPDYVDMPKSRRSRFFSHFHRKNKKAKAEENSPQQWLNVEDDFDARTVGRERGGWDSFQEGDVRAHTADRPVDDQAPADALYDGYEEYDANDGEVPNGTYEQGIIYESEVTYENPVSRPTQNTAAYSDDIIDEEPVDESSEPLPDDDKRRWQGGAFSAQRADENRSAQVRREIQDIYEFADDQLNTEVWFVALGAQEEADNAGIKSFLETHADEMRGAIIVSIEGMGAGTLGYGNQEGVFKHYAPSTRIKRFLHTTSEDTGIKPVRSDQSWRNSAASVAMAHGLQAVSLMGLDGDKPAFYAQSDDVLENIDEELVRQNADFLWQFLKEF